MWITCVILALEPHMTEPTFNICPCTESCLVFSPQRGPDSKYIWTGLLAGPLPLWNSEMGCGLNIYQKTAHFQSNQSHVIYDAHIWRIYGRETRWKWLGHGFDTKRVKHGPILKYSYIIACNGLWGREMNFYSGHSIQSTGLWDRNFEALLK